MSADAYITSTHITSTHNTHHTSQKTQHTHTHHITHMSMDGGRRPDEDAQAVLRAALDDLLAPRPRRTASSGSAGSVGSAASLQLGSSPSAGSLTPAQTAAAAAQATAMAAALAAGGGGSSATAAHAGPNIMDWPSSAPAPAPAPVTASRGPVGFSSGAGNSGFNLSGAFGAVSLGSSAAHDHGRMRAASSPNVQPLLLPTSMVAGPSSRCGVCDVVTSSSWFEIVE